MSGSLYTDLLKLMAVAILVLANAFFVAAEFSLVSLRRTRIAEMAARGEAGAEAVQKAIEDPDRVIAATQLGITLASLGLGWLGEPALSHLMEPLISFLPQSLQTPIAFSATAALSFALITFLHVVAGELAPKSIALQDPEGVALVVAAPMLWAERVFKPAIWALNGSGRGLLRLVGVKPASGHELVHSVEELKMLVTASAQGGVVEAEESQMLHAVFDFGELVVRQVMAPRTEIIGVEADTPLPEILNLISASTYTKFPVYEDNLDQILGIVHVKTLLNAMQSPNSETCVARKLAREALFVPETLSVNALLRQFRLQRQHIAIVLDEFGGTAGLVTLEDLLEEIVGDIGDPFDIVNPGFQKLPDNSVLVDGLTLIEDVNDKLGLKLKEPNYDTIAGYVMGKLGRIPRLNDTVEADGVRFSVAEMDGLRISHVSLARIEPQPEAEATGDGAGKAAPEREQT